MAYRVLIVRVLRVSAVTVVIVFLCVGGWIQFQQRLLRWRAERLLADIQSIRLYQSDWQDAQRLMHRWGAWGHYDGQCSATDCQYAIHLSDASWRGGGEFFEWLVRLHAMPMYEWFGGRTASMYVQFIVQDGTIWRTSTSLLVWVVPRHSPSGDNGYAVIIDTKSRGTFRRFRHSTWVLGEDAQLAQHPNYKAGRPGGCTFCIEAQVTYGTHTPQAEIRRLTSLDLSCLTRLLHPCARIEDVLPAALEWHLYDWREPNYHEPPPSQLPPEACDIPIWALGRDAASALMVEVLSNGRETSHGEIEDTAKVRIVSVLKGPSRWAVGSVVKAYPFSGNLDYPPLYLPEPLTPGQQYVVLPRGWIDETEPDFVLERCGRLEDTPQVIEELRRGFAQNDKLRRPEL